MKQALTSVLIGIWWEITSQLKSQSTYKRCIKICRNYDDFSLHYFSIEFLSRGLFVAVRVLILPHTSWAIKNVTMVVFMMECDLEYEDHAHNWRIVMLFHDESCTDVELEIWFDTTVDVSAHLSCEIFLQENMYVHGMWWNKYKLIWPFSWFFLDLS